MTRAEKICMYSVEWIWISKRKYIRSGAWVSTAAAWEGCGNYTQLLLYDYTSSFVTVRILPYVVFSCVKLKKWYTFFWKVWDHLLYYVPGTLL